MTRTVSADPLAMKAFSNHVMPHDSALKKLVTLQLAPALDALNQTKPDPAYLAASVSNNTITADLGSYADWCLSLDLRPLLVGDAFSDIVKVHPAMAVTADDLDRQLATWRFGHGDLQANLVPGSPAEWKRVVGDCLAEGGGFIRGPDGLPYAIVTDDNQPQPTPGIGNPGQIQLHDAAAGSVVWGPSGVVYGIGKPVGPDVRGAAGTAGAMGYDVSALYPVTSPDGHNRLLPLRPLGPQGYPDERIPYAPPLDDGQAPPPPRSRGWPAVGLAAAGGVEIVNGALAGLDEAQSWDNHRVWGYRVVYYRGLDGSRRARLMMHQFLSNDDASYTTTAPGSLDARGNIVIGPSVTIQTGGG